MSQTKSPSILFSLNSNTNIRYEEFDECQGEETTNDPNNESKKQITAHDWQSYNTQDVFDDGTQTFFW